MIRISILMAFGSILFAGCYYDNKEELYPRIVPCDTNAVTFKGTISPLMNSYCTNCHGTKAVSLGAGIDLRSYEGAKAKADRIYGALNQDPGYNPMPKNTGKLDDCKLNQVKKWIDAGAQNN